MSVFVTGGAGFIGSRLARSLAEAGEPVVVFDNLHPQVHGPDPVLPDWPENVRFEKGDVRDGDALSAAIRKADPRTIHHLAAETGTGQSYDEPTRYCDVNVLGTTRLLEAIRAIGAKGRRLVLASSRAVYGEGAGVDASGAVAAVVPRLAADLSAGRFGLADAAGAPLTPCPTPESFPPSPTSVYASSKLMQEFLVRQCAEGSGLETVVLRFQNVYGPGQSLLNAYTGVLSIFSKQILDGKILDIYEDGEIARDFVFVDDVVASLVAAGAALEAPQAPINIGSGVETKILDAAKILIGTLGGAAPGYRISGAFRVGDVRYAVADVARAKALLDWTPKVGVREGLLALAVWAKTERAAGRI